MTWPPADQTRPIPPDDDGAGGQPSASGRQDRPAGSPTAGAWSQVPGARPAPDAAPTAPGYPAQDPYGGPSAAYPPYGGGAAGAGAPGAYPSFGAGAAGAGPAERFGPGPAYPMAGSPYGGVPTGSYPPAPPPRRSRTGVVVAGTVGVLVLIAGVGFGSVKLANRLVDSGTKSAASASSPAVPAASAEPTDVPTTIIKQSTQPLAAGQTRVTDAADGLSLVLPAGWQQAPTSGRQLQSWLKKAQQKNPGLSALSSPQTAALLRNVALFAVYTKAKRPQDIEYMMVMRAPVALPPLSQEMLPAIQDGMAKTKGLQGVNCQMTRVAGAPAVLATMTTKLNTAASAVTLHARAYIVNSPTVNGFYTYFYSRTDADQRGDIATIMGSFDPNYTGK